MVSAAPASVPSLRRQRPFQTVISSPYSMKVERVSADRSASRRSPASAAPRRARRACSIAGSTWMPSTIMPKKTSGDSSAAAIGPGSRLSSGRIALKRCVKPAQAFGDGGAGLRVSRHRMTERDAHAGLRELAHETIRHGFGRERHQRDAGPRRQNERVVLDGGLCGNGAGHARRAFPARGTVPRDGCRARRDPPPERLPRPRAHLSFFRRCR